MRQVSSQVKSSQVVAKATELVAKATELVLKNTEWACHAAYRAGTRHTACHAREGARVHTYSSTRHMGLPSAAACAAACYSRLDGGTHVLTVSAAVKTRPQSREAVAHCRYTRLAGGLSTRGHERGRPQSCLLLQDLRAALAPRCVAVSVATALRRRACSLAHASMPHAARRALATCDPHACAGPYFFHLRRATTTTRCRASPSTPTTRGRRRRRRARRGYRRFAASTVLCGRADRLVSTTV